MPIAEQRRFPRKRVDLSVAVDNRVDAPKISVIDLSEGGAALAWQLADGATVGETVRLRFMLMAEQSLDLDARIVRVAAGRAGVEFLPRQRDVVRQLLAEAMSED